jgi:hypothetical protein
MVRISGGEGGRGEIGCTPSQWTTASHAGSAVVGRLGSVPVHGESPWGEIIAVKRKQRTGGTADHSERQPYRVRLPGFIADEEIGLGDVIKRATYAMGIKPCGGCEHRAAALNRWMVFSR